MADLKYCPACLDKWSKPTTINQKTGEVTPREPLHDTCQRALEAIRNG